MPWCRPRPAPSPPLSAPPSSFLSPPSPPPALEFRLILPPPPSSASSPQASRRLRREPKHKHSSPSAGATSAARRRPLRHVAARSELRPFVTSAGASPPLHPFPRPFSEPSQLGRLCGAGRGVSRDHCERPGASQPPPSSLPHPKRARPRPCRRHCHLGVGLGLAAAAGGGALLLPCFWGSARELGSVAPCLRRAAKFLS